MNKIERLLILVIAIMLTFACSFGPKEESSGVENTADAPAVTSASGINSSAQNAENIDLSMLGDVQQAAEGGFSFRPITGYELEISGGVVSMLAPGADPDVGPVIQIMGMPSDQEMTVDQLYQQLKSGTDMQLGPAVDISINGINGLQVDVSGSEADADKRGQIILLVVDGYQQFVMMAGSPKEEWEAFAPVVNAVKASIEFIPLTPGEQTNALSNGTYAYTNRNVIRDLDEKDGIVYAATLGGLVAWRLDTSNLMQVVPMNGVGHISANAVVVCDIPEPRVLVGTLEGIRIFNPNTGLWEQNTLLPVESNVNTSKIDRLYCDQANHRLLIGYSGLGVLDFNSGDFQQYTDKSGLLWNSITDITVNGKDIWIASGYKGIAKISNDQVSTFSKENGMPDEVAYAVAFSKDGTLWIGANSGLISYKNGVWNMFGSESPAKLASVNEIEVVSDKSLWVATAPLGIGRLCLYNIANATCDQDYAAPDNAAILALTTTEISNAIFGTGKGIHVYDNGSLLPLKTSDQLLSNYVDALSIAPDGMLWVGTDGGIQVLDPANPDQTWVTYQQQSQTDMGGNWASSIAFSKDGAAWITMINGSASRYQQNQWQAYKNISSFNAVAIDTQNRAWFGDDGKGIIVLNEQGDQVMSFTTADGLPNDNVQALLADMNGGMWIGTTQGLAKYENNAIITIFNKVSKDIPNVYIRALALNQDGKLLIGTFTGVSEFDGKNVTTLIDFLKEGYSDARLTTLACTTSGEVWIGTDKGLLHGNPTIGWSKMTTDNGLLTNYISALTVDQYNSVWVGGGGSNFDGGGLLHIVP